MGRKKWTWVGFLQWNNTNCNTPELSADDTAHEEGLASLYGRSALRHSFTL